MKIKNDASAIRLIEKFLNGNYDREEERDQLLDALDDYQTGLSEVMYFLESDLTPEEILALARERNKPIVL